jgi:hypothetical protein
MADMITNFFDFIMNGKTNGIPNIYIIIGIVGFIFIIYLIATRKPKIKEFKPMDMKKETKRRFKREYKYFGMPLNKNIYEPNNEKPSAYAIGYMKVTEMKELKRLEPIYIHASANMLTMQHEKQAHDIYNKSYAELNEVEKKNVHEVAEEEMKNEKVEIMERDMKIKIVRGRKEIQYAEPIPMFAFKICSAGMMNKLLARFIGVGIDWALLNADQVIFEEGRITLTANFQRRTPFDIFVFSKAGTNLVQDITFGVERENIWQETANQIPRAVHFDTEASKALIYRREDAKIEKEKHKAQTETHEFG